MANNRLELCESTSTCGWGSRHKLSHTKNKREPNSKIHLAVNERGMPVKFIVTEGTRADCKEAINLLKNLDVKLLFADRAYDTNEILFYITKRNIKSVVPPKRNRLEQCNYSCTLYCFRYVIENTFLVFKRWRSIATRYAKKLWMLLCLLYL